MEGSDKQYEGGVVARVWQAAAEGLPLPPECTAKSISRELASSLLAVAIWNDHGHTVTALLELLSRVAGAEDLVNTIIRDSNTTPLSCAACHGSSSAAASLLKARARVGDVDDAYAAPVSYAAEEGHVDMLRILADAKADLDARNGSGATPLELAAYEGHAAAVSLLVERNAHMGSRNGGSSALSFAVSERHLSVVCILLEAKADVDAGCVWSPAKPMRNAAWSGDVALVRLLIRAKGCVDLADSFGRTPLFYAAAEGHLSTVEALLAARANAFQVDKSGRTPALQAARKGHPAVVQALERSSPSDRGRATAELP